MSRNRVIDINVNRIHNAARRRSALAPASVVPHHSHDFGCGASVQTGDRRCLPRRNEQSHSYSSPGLSDDIKRLALFLVSPAGKT
jgi:hypothetical protein